MIMKINKNYLFSWFEALLRRLTPWRKPPPIATPEALAAFVRTRAAYIAQTTLYGYIKTRAGTRYVSLFEDDVFVESINIAKWRVFVACLADLSVFAAARVALDAGHDHVGRVQLARYCFQAGLTQDGEEKIDPVLRREALCEFDERLSGLSGWDGLARGEAAFSGSPEALVKWAPIAEELKALDVEIVQNSVRFRWKNVRAELVQRLEGAPFQALEPI